MLKNTVTLLVLMIYGCAFASGLPENVEVTAENAESLSISLSRIDSGESGTDLYQLVFSSQLEGCAAGRVQTTLLSGESEVSASSMDYRVGSSEPSVLLHMPSSGYDIAITLQYCCSDGLSPGCKKSVSIKSIKALAKQ